ncbi:MAG: phenylalanine 4-monooxygenase [Pseudomonadota bacterium]
MGQGIEYRAHAPGADGIIPYTDDEHAVWAILMARQTALLPGRACQPYIDALATLDFSDDRIPQCKTLSEQLQGMSGWSVTPVPAIIPADEFYALLAQKRFPAASFIRHRRELDYLEEPDIFHELFGHAPHLTDERFGAFTHAYGVAGRDGDALRRKLLARLYWFTVEFGLVSTDEGLRAYGAGICSSPGELEYALNAPEPERRAFDVLDILRTPFRIDTFQPIYYVLESFDTLFDLANIDLTGLMQLAQRLGDFQPRFDDAAYG